MPRHRALIMVLVVAVLASGLHVPFVYHGHSTAAAEAEHLHVIVHRHHGRLHAHIHHHGPDRRGHHDEVGDRGASGGACHDCEHDDCEADHSPEQWLSSVRSDDRSDALAQTRLVNDMIDGAAWSSAEAFDAVESHGRAPPGRASPFPHLERMRPVILRL